MINQPQVDPWDEANNPPEMQFTNGKKTRRIKLDGDQWMKLVNFIYSHVDGPARAKLDVNANTTQVQVNLYLPKKDNDGNS